MTTKTFTVTEIKENVSTNAAWAEKAIIALYHEQTGDEQATKTTHELNGRGFNGTDAGILSSFAEQMIRRTNYHLSEKQLKIAFKKLPKYAGQLSRIAAEKTAVAPVAGTAPTDDEIEQAIMQAERQQ